MSLNHNVVLVKLRNLSRVNLCELTISLYFKLTDI